MSSSTSLSKPLNVLGLPGLLHGAAVLARDTNGYHRPDPTKPYQHPDATREQNIAAPFHLHADPAAQKTLHAG